MTAPSFFFERSAYKRIGGGFGSHLRMILSLERMPQRPVSLSESSKRGEKRKPDKFDRNDGE
jgi:hypothetical protein